MLRKLSILLAALVLIVPAIAQDEEPFALTIMHTNDVSTSSVAALSS